MIMSRETLEHLNRNVLVGQTAWRGNAWYYRKGLQGDESNHYPGFIPVGDVVRRLASWEAAPARVAVEVPATIEDMTHLSDDGQPVRWDVQTDRQAIVRSDNAFVMGLFKSGYEPHQIKAWLLDATSNILGDTLGITSAGLLKGGAVAWVEVSVPETVHMAATGVDYRPNLLGGTSFDGSLATFWKRTIQHTICDNTFEVARGEAGQAFKIKHTKYSGFKLKDAREALNIISQAADAFEDQVTALCQTTVTDRQWAKFLDALVPMTKDGQPLTGRGRTMALGKQDTLRRLWIRDPRVSPWQGTAWGVLQAVNTYGHHEAIVRGASRDERNMLNAITGQTAKDDEETLRVLAGVLSNV